jgi:cobyrinic acid a,c-diamide synthase
MTAGLTLGYRTAVAHDSLLTRAGERVTGHEFHRTTVTPGYARPAWTLGAEPAGFASETLHASYLHVHWAGHPHLAARLAAAAHACPPADLSGAHVAPTTPPDDDAVDLHHHGDREVGAGLVDLAVNVHPGPRPEWLERALHASLDEVGAYPDARHAARALALWHGVAPECVLPTAGGAEAFTLVARMRAWRHPVVVHPQFTEPEAALAAAGHRVTRVVLDDNDGFRFDPAAVPEDADLVIVGNPTNPTGVLHPRALLASLVRPGRVVVVDEAFMDAVPGEAESLVGVPGVLVLRSLTKTWSLPGLRAGYVVGGPAHLAELSRQQPPWSVSTPAAAAMVVCSTAEARAEADGRALAVAGWRAVLVDGLADRGLVVAGDPATPFVLVHGPAGLRERLREQGFAVRRADTFPGLGPDWVRIAVRDPATTKRLLGAVDRVAVRV